MDEQLFSGLLNRTENRLMVLGHYSGEDMICGTLICNWIIQCPTLK